MEGSAPKKLKIGEEQKEEVKVDESIQTAAAAALAAAAAKARVILIIHLKLFAINSRLTIALMPYFCVTAPGKC